MGLPVLKYALAAALMTTSAAHAFESEDVRGYTPSWDASSYYRPITRALPLDGSRIKKFNLALDTIGIPRERAPDFSEFPAENAIAQGDLAPRLKYLDPESGLQRYLNLTPGQVNLFQDFFSRLLPAGMLQYSVGTNGDAGSPTDSQDLISHLQQISEQVKDPTQEKPLTGLKIVIDPGHMGTDFWDNQTGKFVKINGVKVSEGQLNLWTARLISNELEELGATVVLTRTEDGPVSRQNYQNFVTTQFVNQYFYNSLDDWMAQYLSLSDDSLRTTIKQKSEVKRAYAASQRTQFFIGGEDLEARSQIIDQERPDIVLDVHFDANLANQLQNSTNALEAFVPGSFRANETGSQVVRSYALKHLLEMRRWNASVDLATEIVNSMSASENVPLQKTLDFIGSTKVKDGVYARNLYINRRNLSALTVYLECLHYDHTSEFYNLSRTNEVGTYHGATFQYPTRLKAIVAGVKTGLLNYFKR